MGKQTVWTPSNPEATRLFAWMKEKNFASYDEFYHYSTTARASFWGDAVDKLGIVWERPFEQVLDETRGKAFPKWFVGGALNIAQSAVFRWADDIRTSHQYAIIYENEQGEVTRYTFAELGEKVKHFSAGLHELGIGRGDVVALYMPMIPETAIALLSLANVGAIAVPCFSGYAAQAVATRLNGAQAKALITAESYSRRGKTVNMLEEARAAKALAPSVEHLIAVASSELGADEYSFQSLYRYEPFETVALSSDDPLMIIYTSGTTGKPKGAVHTHSGFPVKAAFDAAFPMDVKQGDVLCWYTDIGWMMGPWLIFGGLVNGASIVLYDGTPDFPDHLRIWQLSAKHHITHLGISPTLIRSLMPLGIAGMENIDLSKLRVIGSTGEPWNEEPWLWLFNEVGKGRIPIFNYSGGTEISGGIFGNVLIKPISPMTFNAALPGMSVIILDANGHRVHGKVGELTLTESWVGMTNGFWQENERYIETYWKRWPDLWVHGDWVLHDHEGFYTITGRSDDVLNVAGKRLGPAEMETALVEHPLVIEAATIGVPDDVKGEVAVCFVTLTEHSDTLQAELQALIDRHLGKPMRPKAIYVVTALPKTRNGKVMRRIIRAAYLQLDTGDLSALENPESIVEIQQLNS